MKSEIATVDTSQFMRLIEIAVQANADPDRLGKLMDLQERWELSKAAEAYGNALAAFQAECPPIHKGRTVDLGKGSGPRYAGLDDIMAVAQPILSKHGLSVSYSADIAEGKLHAVCKVRKGRHTETNEITLPVPDQMRVNDTQKMGAAFSYAKRYALCAALNITVTDQDTDASNLNADTYITEHQADTIAAFLERMSESDKASFYKWAGCPTLNKFPASKYQSAIRSLKQKLGDK